MCRLVEHSTHVEWSELKMADGRECKAVSAVLFDSINVNSNLLHLLFTLHI